MLPLSCSLPRPAVLFRVVLLCAVCFLGSLVGLIANGCYYLLCPDYFFIVLNLWNDDDPLYATWRQGVFEGGVIGLGCALFLLTNQPPGNLTVRSVLRRSLAAFMTLFLCSLILGGCASAGMATYHLLYLPNATFEDWSFALRFYFIGGSICGWYAGAVVHFLVFWWKRRHSQRAQHQPPFYAF